MSNWPDINIAQHPSWRVQKSPYGSGLLLLVDRGINAEARTDVYSGFTHNVLDYEDVLKCVKDFEVEWSNAISGFLTFVGAYPRLSRDEHNTHLQTDWDAIEIVAAQFCTRLINEIAARANYLYLMRHEALAAKQLDNPQD